MGGAQSGIGGAQGGGATAGTDGVEQVDDLLGGDGRCHGDGGGVEIRERRANAAGAGDDAGDTEGDIVGALIAEDLERQLGARDGGEEGGGGGGEADEDEVDVQGRGGGPT